ncbi:MAG: hypothetical protein LWX11_03875, partial [Firmicutes bacterium]|nr:hypothetical protein [Bacillota bacterium]
MSKRGLGSLADLAKILEEASNPESVVREDRKEVKPKAVVARKSGTAMARVIDPKRKAWYDKRLKEQSEKTEGARMEAEVIEPIVKPAVTKAVANRVGSTLLQTLAATKDAKS